MSILEETRIRLMDVRKLHPTQISKRTVYSWMRQGLVPRGGGDRIRLEAYWVGEWHTSVEAYRRFVESLNPRLKVHP